MINLPASEKTLKESMVHDQSRLFVQRQCLRSRSSENFVAKSLLHLESKVENIKVKDGNSV